MSKDLIAELETKMYEILGQLDPKKFEKMTVNQAASAFGIIYDRIQKEKAKLKDVNPFEGMTDDEIEKISGKKIVRLEPRQNFGSYRGEYKKKPKEAVS